MQISRRDLVAFCFVPCGLNLDQSQKRFPVRAPQFEDKKRIAIELLSQ